MEGLNKLPEGWKIVVSSEIMDIRDGTHDTPKYVTMDGIPLITSKNLKDNKIDFEKINYISQDDHYEISKRSKVENGDILFAMIGTIGNPAIIKGDANFSIKNVGLFKKNESVIIPDFFVNFLRSTLFEKQLNDKKLLKGTTQKFIPLGSLRRLEIPLPPLSTQQAIVSKIEELFSELDNGIANLKTAQQQLKTYRQSVLKWAFEGKLTKMSETGFTGLEDVQDGQDIQDEKGTRMGLVPMTSKGSKKSSKSINSANPDADNNVARTGIEPVIFKDNKKSSKSINPVNPDADKSELPEGWKWVKLAEITTLLGDGLHGTPKYTINGEYYFINGNNLQDGKIIFKDSTKKVSLEEYLKYKKDLTKSTILVSINGTLGNTAFYNDEKVILGKSACYFNLSNEANKYYIRYIITSQRFINYAIETATGSTIPNVSLKAMREFEVPLPPLEEQHQIVQEIESRLSVADKMEENINASLQQAEALRQSILKKAFEGKLVIEKQAPVYKPKNEYFYQMQVLGLIAKASKQKDITHGEMTIAKYAYVLDKIYDVPTLYEYKRWHLGPYAPEIKKVINNKTHFKITKQGIDVLNEQTLFKYANPYKEQIEFAVNDLAGIFTKYQGKERAHKIELFATVCKVIEDIQTMDLQKVRSSMKDWKIDLKTSSFKNKAEKFSEPETESCLKYIAKKGWDEKLIKRIE